eukprot:TRINITY_DN25564_c0_g3_i1.p1 TRINITY_DN25564_c0_g3~~TRINITY_DN25564_c0_g3_i1.p1  ORF type:complete len:230 (+),score=38.52 TRINITY_DN25564_c0_g3_i1:52-690(+)
MSQPGENADKVMTKQQRKEKTRELLVAFKNFDRNGNMTLDIHEFRALLEAGNANLTELQLKALFSVCDVDKSGSIDFEEFVKFVYSPPSMPSIEAPEELAIVYKKVAAKDGLVSGSEFRMFCKTCNLCGKGFKLSDIDVVYAKVKGPAARTITFDEFQHALVEIALRKGCEPSEVYRKALQGILPEGMLLAASDCPPAKMSEDPDLQIATST